MAATTWVIWLCACQTMGWCLSVSLAFKVAEHSFARALADAIQRAHKDCKNKHAVDTAIILFAQCPLYLCYFSS